MGCKDCKKRLVLLQYYDTELRSISTYLEGQGIVLAQMERLKQKTGVLIKEIETAKEQKKKRSPIQADDSDTLHFGVSQETIDS